MHTQFIFHKKHFLHLSVKKDSKLKNRIIQLVDQTEKYNNIDILLNKSN